MENKLVNIHVQYIKDLSFENPEPLKSFANQNEEQPEINVSVQASAENLGENNFEVTLSTKIDAKHKEETMFILELEYSAISTVSESVEEKDVERTVMVDVPYLLFPYVRNIISDITRDGGFPPLHLSPMDFQDLYEKQKQDGEITEVAADSSNQVH